VLSDRDLDRRLEPGHPDPIIVTPRLADAVRPGSIDIRLGRTFRTFRAGMTYLDSARPVDDLMTTQEVPPGLAFLLPPLGFALGVTLEAIRVPHDLACQLDGRSSLARLGVFIHLVAGYADPGWGDPDGKPLTFELFNVQPFPVALWPGTRIAQLRFAVMTSEVLRPYGDERLGSHYTGDGPEPSRLADGVARPHPEVPRCPTSD
jgi:dCTP deaminase